MNSLRNKGFPGRRQLRIPVLLIAILVLAGCASQAAQEAEQAAATQAQVAAEQEAARVAADQARQQAEAEERARQARVEEQQRQEVERRRQAEIARAEAEARAQQERQAREETERRQREVALRQQREVEAIARAEAERERKLARIVELEAQIAAMQTSVADTEDANAGYREAILAAEELMAALTAEQAKYENYDANGNLLDPLAKDRIQELELRKNQLVQQAESAAN